MPKHTSDLGKKGELFVAQFLREKGFTILALNEISKFGEIDIIAAQDDLIAFVEVKLRKNPLFHISAVIVPSKQLKIIKTAKWYIYTNKINEKILRFDAALVSVYSDDNYKIEYIENAFTASE